MGWGRILNVAEIILNLEINFFQNYLEPFKPTLFAGKKGRGRELLKRLKTNTSMHNSVLEEDYKHYN